MADNSTQGGLDTIATDELATINGVSAIATPPVKVQRVKPGYGADGDFNDVTAIKGLPVASAQSAVIVQTLATAGSTVSIDTQGYSWLSVQVTASYTGQTSLACQCSNDGVNWFSIALSPVAATSSGLATTLGQVAGIQSGPIPARYIRFTSVGTGSGGTTTITAYLTALPGVLQSQGANANLSAISGSIAPAIALSVLTLGTGTGNSFQVRVTGTGDAAVTTLLAAVSGQIPYVTSIYWSIWGTGINTPRLFRVVAAANALIEHNILGHPQPGGGTLVAGNGASGERHFRNPWKTMSTTNNILQYAVTSQGTAVGNWELIVEGYYQSS